MASDYTGISISHVARDELRRFAAVAGGSAGRRITISDALRLAVYIATAHLSDVTSSAIALGIIPSAPTPEGTDQ